MEEYFQIGIIASTHGLRGEVKVYPTTDDVKRFRGLKEVILDPHKTRTVNKRAACIPAADLRKSDKEESGRILLEIESVKFFKQFAILKFRGMDRIEDVEKYRSCPLLVPRSNAVRLKRDEYFVADLMGLTVRDEDGTEIGVLREVLETGANDVYVIGMNDGRELLLPAIRQCVLEVNVEAGYIRIHILEGLL
ncbi:MAG: 16S rRNA processing protein RimM [Lachnospiraceae bacterium]|nr:16S rRNA processing protein RimM [Lachnospiraceae bacterium]